MSSVLPTGTLNFAPQSGDFHRITLVFCDSQMLGSCVHAVRYNYASKKVWEMQL